MKIHRSLPGEASGFSWPDDRVPTAVGIVQAGLEGVPLSALVAADAALRRRQTTKDELTSACRLLGGSRGIGPVRAILHEADARIGSPGEIDDVSLIRGRVEQALVDSRRWAA